MGLLHPQNTSIGHSGYDPAVLFFQDASDSIIYIEMLVYHMKSYDLFINKFMSALVEAISRSL